MKALAPGSRVGDRYVIEAPLAKGGMGAVYRAHDEKLRRPVALKVLLVELAEDPTLVARFEREAMAAARLSHPGIVQVLDFGKEPDGAAFLVMELLAGETLSACLEARGRLPPPRAADVIGQALGALATAHAAGIVHRDLKPANLMLVPLGPGRELVKVLDFGIAQLKSSDAYTRLTQTGVVLGTPSFMAPEQAHGQRLDERTDVYAMGVVAWCCLTGQRPFAAKDPASVITRVLGEMPPRADRVAADVPIALAVAVERAMQKNPFARFGSALEFADAIRGAAATRVGHVPGGSTSSARGAPEEPTAATLAGRGSPAPVAARAPSPPTAPMAMPPSVTVPSVVAPSTALPPSAARPPSAAPARPTPTFARWLVGLASIAALGLVLSTVVLVAGVILVQREASAVAREGRVPGLAGLTPHLTATTPSHPPPPGMTPICAAAYRCCLVTGMTEGACDLFGTNPPSCETNRANFAMILEQYGEDPRQCDPSS